MDKKVLKKIGTSNTGKPTQDNDMVCYKTKQRKQVNVSLGS
jgi:hypothetical protein